VAVSYRCTIQT